MSTDQNAVRLLLSQLDAVHGTLAQTVEGVSAEIADYNPDGLARSIGSQYAHILIVEDLAVHGILQQGAPLFASSWAGKTGFDTDAPSDPSEWPGWSSRTNSDIVSSRDYGQAVHAATKAYIGSLSDADLEHEVDLTNVGFGMQTVGSILSLFVVINCAWHTGEIASQKGSHNLVGYPF